MTAKKAKKPAKLIKSAQNDTAKARRLRFIEAFLSNGENASQAALAAGFAKRSAGQQGSRLLKNDEVRAEIDKRRTEVLDKFRLTTERTYQEIARLAYADPRKFFNSDGSIKPVHELDDDCAAVIASIELDEIKADGQTIGVTRKIKSWDKNAALEKAAKILGLFGKDNAQSQPMTRIVVMPAKDAF
jgi:phage terminase small subunit